MPRGKGWIASVLLHVLVLVPAFMLAASEPWKQEEKNPIEVVFYEAPPVPEPEAAHEPLPEPELETELRPEPPRREERLAPTPEPVVVADARPLRPEPRTRPPAPEPRAPRPEPAPKKPVRTVKTAGFAPSAAPAQALQPTRTASRGAFEEAPPTQTAVTTRRTTTALGGFGDDDEAPRREGTRRRTVSTDGFGATVADASVGAGPSRSVERGGFGGEGTAPAAGSGRSRALKVAPIDTPVEIVSKPKPVYTDEARDLRIEGEVVLEVTFGKTGRLTVKRVVDGLGHGLDEAAVNAAKDISFEPARRDGKAVDYTATLRVVFRLA